MNHGDIFVDRLVGAHPEIAHAQPGFEIDVVGFATPAMAVKLESGVRLQVEIRTAEVRRARGSGMPFAVDHADGKGHRFQLSRKGAGKVSAGGAIRSGDGDLRVPLVPSGQSMLVETLSIYFSVVLESGDRVPLVPMRADASF